jgi:transcriptional regulator of acetoin/glycerol metabolism
MTKRALEKAGWNKAKAARLLGMSRRTIYRKIEEHKIKTPSP